MKAREVRLLIELERRLQWDQMTIFTIKSDLRYVLQHNQIQLKSSARIVRSPSELTFYSKGIEYTLNELIDFCTQQYKHKIKVGLQQLLACGINHREVEEILETYISNIFYESTL